MKERYTRQPTLDEMLADPIIWTLMESDSVDERELRNLLQSVAADLVAASPDTIGTQMALNLSRRYRRGVGMMC